MIFSILIIFIISFTFIFKVGVIVENKEWFYLNGKGTFKGKTFFSFLLVSICVIPLYFFNIEDWYKAITLTFAFLSYFELVKTITFGEKIFDIKLSLFFLLSTIVIYESLIILPSLLGILKVLIIISLGIVTDTLFNLIGVRLSKLPEDKQIWRLRYPNWVSGNKSFMAVIITCIILIIVHILILSAIYLFTENRDFIYYLKDYGFSFIFTLVFSIAFGDAFFSVFKRILNVGDYYRTLGPIGGLLDRIDGWLFAILFVYYVLPYIDSLFNNLLDLLNL